MLSWTPGNSEQARSLAQYSLFNHQLAKRTPGIKPRSANLRKQMRHKPNLRYTARGRPHSWQRDSRREVNFGVRLALAIFDLLATEVSSHRGREKNFVRVETCLLEKNVLDAKSSAA
jgi:hypothetical protein